MIIIIIIIIIPTIIITSTIIIIIIIIIIISTIMIVIIMIIIIISTMMIMMIITTIITITMIIISINGNLLFVPLSSILSIAISFGNFSNGGQELRCHCFQLLSLSKRHLNIKENCGPFGGVFYFTRKIKKKEKNGIRNKIKIVN